jgi:universal stress protein A
MFNAKRLLVPVDFSPESELALDWAVMAVKDEPDAVIELCHVLPDVMAPIGPEAIAYDYMTAFDREKKAIAGKLKTLQRRIPEPISSTYTIGKGGIAREIERLCKEKAIDLVLMTTHGRRGLSHFLHGSTTEETVRLAPCPVLVLHLNQVAKEMVAP